MEIIQNIIKIISFAGGSIGLLLGILKVKEFLSKTALIKRKERFYFHATQRFMADRQFESAKSQLKLILEQDADNYQALELLIECEFQEIYTLFCSEFSLGLANRYSKSGWQFITRDQVNLVLKKIYYINNLYPKTQDANRYLMEAQLHKIVWEFDNCLAVLKRGLARYSDDPHLLAESALIQAHTAEDSSAFEASQKLLLELTDTYPSTGKFAYYLGCTGYFKEFIFEFDIQAIKLCLSYFYEACQRVKLDPLSYWNKVIKSDCHEFGRLVLFQLSKRYGDLVDAPLNIDSEEKLNIILEFLEGRENWKQSGDSRIFNYARAWLVSAYYETGKYAKAIEVLDKHLASENLETYANSKFDLRYAQYELNCLKKLGSQPKRQAILESFICPPESESIQSA